MQHDPSDPRADVGALVFVALVLWFSLVFGLGVAGHLEDLPRVLVPITLAGSTATVWLLSRRVDALRRWMLALDVRALVGLHVVRWPIGVWFLVAERSGTLPGELARLAGWGDIATGVLALVALACDARTPWGRRALLAFNAAGLVDILAVVVTAQRLLLFGDAAALRVGHPFVVLPMFVVPLVIVAHAWTFVRLAPISVRAHASPRGRPARVSKLGWSSAPGVAMVAAMMVRRATTLLPALLLAATGCQWRASAGTPPTVSPQPTAPAASPGPAPAPTPDAADPLAAWSLPARPTWTDRYADDAVGDLRFFNISALMREHGLTRDRAVELQNHYRDASRADPGGDPTAHFEAALAKAKRGEFEGRRDVARLAEAAFIVVFDLDDTLYDQSYDPSIAATCADLRLESGGKPKAIKLAPGADAALDRVAALGGAVVIFTAAPDEPSLANLRAWQFGGKPLPDHPAIAGVLTNSHLVLQDKREGDGASDPKRGHPVIEPSKDLRIVDEGLTRAILVDDNPLRTFQPRNLRLTKKFDAASYCTTKDAKLKRAFERTLPDVVAEIEDSLRWAKQAKAPFATAYLPHSQIGRLAVGFLRGAGMSEKAAIEYVRTHPEVVDRDF